MNNPTRFKLSYIFIMILLFSLILSSCVDSSWLDLVGRWKDDENPIFEIEFTQGGKYNEYINGEVWNYGEFVADGNNITLYYSSPCGGENQASCTVRLGFEVVEDKLTITDSDGDIYFSKVQK